VLGTFARLAGYLSIDELSIEKFFERGQRLLDDGVSIIAFPEGTRSGGRKMGPFRGAVFRLALRTKATIVPLCISGNENIPRKGSLLLNPGRIEMRKLPALTWDDYKDMTAFRLKGLVRETIAKELATLDDRHDDRLS